MYRACNVGFLQEMDGRGAGDGDAGKGTAATKCRTPMEWRASDQGKVMAQHPPVALEPTARSIAGIPHLLPAKAARPLSDVIVVDFSHVIASPSLGYFGRSRCDSDQGHLTRAAKKRDV